MVTIEFNDLLRALAGFDITALEGVEIEGDIELEFEPGAGMDAAVAAYIGQESQQAAMHMGNIAAALGIPMTFVGGPAVPSIPSVLADERFSVEPEKWRQSIEVVTLGGNNGRKAINLGGQNTMPFYLMDGEIPNPPRFTVDVFDMPVPLAKAVKEHYEDVMESPTDWARKVVKDFGADLITIHLVSTDPALNDTSPRDAAKTVEDLLQAVDVPIVIGGAGNPEKDPAVLEAAAEAASGERCLLASADLDMDFGRVAKAAIEHDHAVLSWTQLNMPNQQELNRRLLKQQELPRGSLVMDPTTAALGYGLDYAFSNIERIRIAGLRGDKELNFPMSSGTTNAWGAREAWMKESPLEGDSTWGPREYRGPLWELITGFTLALAGGDIFMMMHPAAVQYMKTLTSTLWGKVEAAQPDLSDWVSREAGK